MAGACTCIGHGNQSEEQQIDRAFSEADAVFVAKVILVKHSVLPEDPKGRYLVEEASFVVSEVMKGIHKVGEVVRVRSMLGSGCARSARNDPPWLDMVDDSDPPVATVAVISAEWLIYSNGSPPYELSQCDRSFPMNLRGGSDAEYLRAKHARSGKKPGR